MRWTWPGAWQRSASLDADDRTHPDDSDPPPGTSPGDGPRDAAGRTNGAAKHVPVDGVQSPPSPNGHQRNGSRPRRTRQRVLVAAGVPAAEPVDARDGSADPDRGGEPPGDGERVSPEDAAYAAVAIERNDDLAAVFGRIDAADSPRVALVAPRGNRELAGQLGMRRLQRHLDLTGKDLILVTRSRLLRVRAREEGVPAVTSLRRVDFDRPGWRGLQLGWMTLRLPTLGAFLAVTLFVASVAAGAAVLFWYVPTAAVTVFLPAPVVADTVDLVADSKAAEVNVAKGVVPAHRREVTIQRSLPGPATGTAFQPLEHAAVGLTFTNRTNQAIIVPKGTVVTAANGMPFTVGTDVSLPARAGSTGEAIALAQRPGTVGNVPKGTATGLDPALADKVSVTNPFPGEKGTDVQQRVVSENDALFIRNVADVYLLDAATKEMLRQYADNETVFRDSARAESTECTPVPAIGQAAQYTELVCTARVSMLTASDADLRQIWVDRFQKLIGPDKMVLDDYFKATVEKAGAFDSTFDRLSLQMRVSAPVPHLVDREGLRQALAGKSRSGVEKVVRERIETSTPPAVKLAGWAPWLPRKAERISTTFKPAP